MAEDTPVQEDKILQWQGAGCIAARQHSDNRFDASRRAQVRQRRSTQVRLQGQRRCSLYCSSNCQKATVKETIT